MADVVTLDALFGPDPPAGDNSGAERVPAGAAEGAASSGAPAGTDITAKIAELERLVGRHREQLTGSQQEILRLRGELEAVKARPVEPVAVSAPPSARVSLADAAKKLLLDNDDTDLAAFEAQLNGRGTVSMEDVKQLLAAHDAQSQVVQRQQGARTTLQNALVQRHPQLLNDQAFINATSARYQALTQDALTQTLYPADPQYVFEEPATGVKYDMRILMAAANEVKATFPAAATPPSLGVTGGSAGAPPHTSGPVVPRSLVEGEAAVLRDPRVQAALQAAGWGSNTKAQVSKLLEFVDPTVKAKWQRGEV